MSLLESHSATWHRYQQSAPDALGNPTGTTEVSGFPVTVTGQFVADAATASREPQGIQQERDATFRSTWLDGRAGDIVTFRGADYLVLSFKDVRHPVGRQFFAYPLKRVELGNRIVATSALDEADPVIVRNP